MANTPKDVIDTVIRDYDSVDPADADYAARRVRLLGYLQMILRYVWNFHEWNFTYKELAFTIAANANSADIATVLPDFLEFGYNGSIFDTDRKIRLREKTMYVLERTRQQMGSSGFNYSYFAVFGGKIQIPYTATSLLNLLAFYRFVAPTLADDTTPFTFGLDKYTDTVLIPGLLFRSQQSKQDAREVWGQMFQQGLVQMSTVENPVKTGTRKMPLAVRGAW